VATACSTSWTSASSLFATCSRVAVTAPQPGTPVSRPPVSSAFTSRLKAAVSVRTAATTRAEARALRWASETAPW